MILVDDTRGLRYKLNPTEEELKEGILQYDPIKDANLWSYVTINSITYTKHPHLVDWDKDVQEWDIPNMGQWPFGNPMLKHHDDEFEEFPSDDENDCDDHTDDSDDDVSSESEDEGYISNEENYDEDEWPINFGIAHFLWCINL